MTFCMVLLLGPLCLPQKKHDLVDGPTPQASTKGDPDRFET
jgi:hypothetical protein